MIFVDTNVISETMRIQPSPAVMSWLAAHDELLAVSTVTIAEIAFGIEKIRPDERSERLAAGLNDWRQRFADRIFPLTDQAALLYGELMGVTYRSGVGVSVPDGMIAAIVKANRGQLATRNTKDFEPLNLDLINPWDKQ